MSVNTDLKITVDTTSFAKATADHRALGRAGYDLGMSMREVEHRSASTRAPMESLNAAVGLNINGWLELGRKVLGAADAFYEAAKAGAKAAGLRTEFATFQGVVSSATSSIQQSAAVIFEASGALDVMGAAATAAAGFMEGLAGAVDGVADEVRTLDAAIAPVVQHLETLQAGLDFGRRGNLGLVRRASGRAQENAALLAALDEQTAAREGGAGGISIMGGGTQQVVVDGVVRSTAALKEYSEAVGEAMSAEDLYLAVRDAGGQKRLDEIAQAATTIDQIDKIAEASRMLAAESEGNVEATSAAREAEAARWTLGTSDATTYYQTLDTVTDSIYRMGDAYAGIMAREELQRLQMVALANTGRQVASQMTAFANTQAAASEKRKAAAEKASRAEADRVKAEQASVESGLGIAGQALDLFLGAGATRTFVRGLEEVAAGASDLAYGNFWGAGAHGVAAASYFKASAEYEKKGGGGGGGGGGAGAAAGGAGDLGSGAVSSSGGGGGTVNRNETRLVMMVDKRTLGTVAIEGINDGVRDRSGVMMSGSAVGPVGRRFY